MEYLEKVKELLEENMTEKGYKLWNGINKLIPNIWSKPTSSTGKWHRRLNGEVGADIDEHVYQMLFSTAKLMRMFDIEKKTPRGDSILFAVALHDALKYGKLGNRKHTDTMHDKTGADMIAENKDIFLKIIPEEDFYMLEEAVRFHSGKWSTDAKNNGDFSFKKYNPETMFVHMLDMLSAADCLKTDMDYKEEE